MHPVNRELKQTKKKYGLHLFLVCMYLVLFLVLNLFLVLGGEIWFSALERLSYIHIYKGVSGGKDTKSNRIIFSSSSSS